MGLVEDSIAARAAGMSYGKYILMHRPQAPVRVIVPEPEITDAEKSELIQCRYCGKLFVKERNRRYCSEACVLERDIKKSRENERRKRQKRKQEANHENH